MASSIGPWRANFKSLRRRRFFVLAVALLVLLAGAAGTRIVAADLGLVPLDRLGLRAVALRARLLTGLLRLGLTRLVGVGVVLFLVGDALLDGVALLVLQRRDRLLLPLDLHAEQLGDDGLLDPAHHLR